MCGVVGFSGTPTQANRAQFIELCREACIRGVHAFGIAYHIPGKGVEVFKSTDFAAVVAEIPDPLPRKIIFHNRYSTSGDHQIAGNNQPIHVNGHALVFNGTVDMGTKEEMESRNGIAMQTENDGELVLRDIIDRGEPFRRLNNSLVTFAGIYLAPDGVMFAFRNSMRPLWLFSVGVDKWVASTLDIASRAKFGENNGNLIKPFKIEPL